MKDIGLLVEGHNGDDDGLGLNVLQVGLRQHPHSLAAAVLGEDERVAAQTHGAGLETVPVHPDGVLTGLTRTLFRETKAVQSRCVYQRHDYFSRVKLFFTYCLFVWENECVENVVQEQETKCRMWSKVVGESYFLWFKLPKEEL